MREILTIFISVIVVAALLYSGCTLIAINSNSKSPLFVLIRKIAWPTVRKAILKALSKNKAIQKSVLLVIRTHIKSDEGPRVIYTYQGIKAVVDYLIAEIGKISAVLEEYVPGEQSEVLKDMGNYLFRDLPDKSTSN